MKGQAKLDGGWGGGWGTMRPGPHPDQATPRPTHRGLAAAVGDHLQHRVLLTSVNAGQVVERGVHGPVCPFSELPGQMPALRLLDLPLENIGQDLPQGYKSL